MLCSYKSCEGLLVVKPHHSVIQRFLSVPHPPLQVGICIPASVWCLFIHANTRVNIYRIHACRSPSPMGRAQLPPAALTNVLMKSLHCISSAFSSVNSHTLHASSGKTLHCGLSWVFTCTCFLCVCSISFNVLSLCFTPSASYFSPCLPVLSLFPLLLLFVSR